jgi:hypothetical protein
MYERKEGRKLREEGSYQRKVDERGRNEVKIGGGGEREREKERDRGSPYPHLPIRYHRQD